MIPNGQLAHKKVLNFITHGGNAIKTSMRYHYMPDGVAKM